MEKQSKIPALESFRHLSTSSLHPSPLTDSNTHYSCTSAALFKNTENAVLSLEQKTECSSNFVLYAKPKLEKIGAIQPPHISASKLKTEFSQLSKHLKKSSQMTLQAQELLQEWSLLFDSKEISDLADEFNKFVKLHACINSSLSERFENIAFKLKPLSKQEHKRNQDLFKSIKAKRNLEEFKKKSTDQVVISQLQDKIDYYFKAVVNSQTLLEKNVREDLRPSLFAYVFLMKRAGVGIDFLLRSTEYNINEFECMLKKGDSIYEANLNFTRSGMMLDIPEFKINNTVKSKNQTEDIYEYSEMNNSSFESVEEESNLNTSQQQEDHPYNFDAGLIPQHSNFHEPLGSKKAKNMYHVNVTKDAANITLETPLFRRRNLPNEQHHFDSTENHPTLNPSPTNPYVSKHMPNYLEEQHNAWNN